MKSLCKLFMVGVFSVGGIFSLIGCTYVDRDHDGEGHYSRKTTVQRDYDGDRTVKTEVRHSD